MRDLTITNALLSAPLTEEEIRREAFLRVVRCLRSNEGKFLDGPVSHYWVILSGRRQDVPRPPRCLALAGKGSAITGVKLFSPTLLSSRASKIFEDDMEWTVDEYSILIPDCYDRLLLKAGPAFLIFGRAARKKLLDEYYDGISNASIDPNYEEWLKRENRRTLTLPVPNSNLLMSIVTPVFQTPPRLLREMIASVLAQTYQNWELILVNASPDNQNMRRVIEATNDSRVRVIECPENLGIASNTRKGAEAARGDYICLVDHDDVIEPQTLAEYVRVIESSNREVGLLYCDEDNLDENGHYVRPVFKPRGSLDLLHSNNYVYHMLTIRRDLYFAVEPSPPDVNGAQDYDLTLKLFETGESVEHVPHILYHWRMCLGSTASDPSSKLYAVRAGSLSLEHHLKRTGVRGEVSNEPAFFTYRVTPALANPLPTLIVLSNKTSVITRRTLEGYAGRVIQMPYKVSALSDALNEQVSNPCALSLLISPEHDLSTEALKRLITTAVQTDILAVSPKTVRQDDLLDFTGTLVRPDGSLGRLSRLLPAQDEGYVGRTVRPYDYLVLNYECCLLDFSKLSQDIQVGPFEELEYALADILVQGWNLGLRSVYMPFAETRLNTPRSLLEREPSSIELQDRNLFLKRHPSLKEGDPSHSPLLNPWDLYYKLNW